MRTETVQLGGDLCRCSKKSQAEIGSCRLPRDVDLLASVAEDIKRSFIWGCELVIAFSWGRRRAGSVVEEVFEICCIFRKKGKKKTTQRRKTCVWWVRGEK